MASLPHLNPLPVGMLDRSGTYTGPGDVTSGWEVWFGLRAFSRSVALGATQKAVNVRRASDNTTSDILILKTGVLDVATAQSFAGTDATGVGAITGTALTFTGGHVGDVVTGGTTLPGTVIVSGSSPAWTVNKSQTVASTTLTLSWGLFVTKWYDQAGGGKDASNSTTAQQPQLLLAGGPGNNPTVNFSGAASQGLTTAASVTGSSSGSISFVAIRTGAFTTIGPVTSSSFSNGFSTAANLIYLFVTSLVTASATDSVWHAANNTINGTSSTIYIDGTSSTVNPGGPVSQTGVISLGCNRGAGQFQTGGIAEVGWNSAVFSAGTQASLNSNQHGTNGYNF